MVSVKYVVKLVNPISKNLYVTDTLKNESSLKATVNNTGIVLSGRYFKNGVYLKASAQLGLGEEYYVNNNEELVLQNGSATSIDVESIFNLQGKLSYEVDPSILANLNILEYDYDVIYKMNHVVETREDVVLFKINSEGRFSIIDGIFNGPSHLVKIAETLAPSESFAYFIVGRTMQVESLNDLYIPARDVHKLSEGFNTLKNRLTTKTNIKFLSTSNGALVQTYEESLVKFSYPAEIDGIEVLEYLTYPREYLNITVGSSYVSLEKLQTFTDNLTVVYELKEEGVLEPALCMVSDKAESLLVGYDIVYNTDSGNLALLDADTEFKKKYIFVQYYLDIHIDDKVYTIENKDVLLNFLNNINKFSHKIVKI